MALVMELRGDELRVQMDGVECNVKMAYVSNAPLEKEELRGSLLGHLSLGARRVQELLAGIERVRSAHALELALARAESALNALTDDDQLQAQMRAFVDDAGSRLEKPRHDRGAQPPKLPDRSRFLNRLAADHPLRANHEAAFAAMMDLRSLGWRPMSASERKRKERADPVKVGRHASA